MNSKFVLSSSKPFETVLADLEAAVRANRFGVLHTYNPKEVLASKGVQLDKNIRIFEVCNPQTAKIILEENPAFSCGVPCRISVWELPGGSVQVGMTHPGMALAPFDPENRLQPLLEEIDGNLRKIIREAV